MNNNIKRNNYIEERIWKHIINWIIYLILPFTCIDILMFFILIGKHDNNTIVYFYPLWIIYSIVFSIKRNRTIG